MTALLNTQITTPGTFFGPLYMLRNNPQPPQNFNIDAVLNGSGGTSVDAYIQISHDTGVTWTDVIHFTQLNASNARSVSPANATAIADPQAASVFGAWWRVKYISVGTYANTTLQITAIGANLMPAGVNF